MDAQHVHVDEISVWSWVAAAAFALIALAAVVVATHDNMRVTIARSRVAVCRTGSAAACDRGPARLTA